MNERGTRGIGRVRPRQGQGTPVTSQGQRKELGSCWPYLLRETSESRCGHTGVHLLRHNLQTTSVLMAANEGGEGQRQLSISK